MSHIINQNVKKFIILVNILYILFCKEINIRIYLSLKDVDDEQSNFATKFRI